MMEVMREGGCLCGAVRYRLEGEPFLVGTCHCTHCRKESGSIIVAYAKWPRTAFTMTGAIATFAGRSFCPSCGSRLFNLHEADVEIRIGSLDEAPTTIAIPMQEGWTMRRERWLHPIDGARQAEQDPPG